MRDGLTLLIAGHETTAAVLTWLVYALSQHPERSKWCSRRSMRWWATSTHRDAPGQDRMAAHGHPA